MTLVAGLRAASCGIPFQPVAGVHGSELARINRWQTLRDPYGSGTDVYVIPAVHPDIAVIHAAEIDVEGNARVYGSPFWDHPLTRAAKRVLITAGKPLLLANNIAPEKPEELPERVLLTMLMVTALLSALSA